MKPLCLAFAATVLAPLSSIAQSALIVTTSDDELDSPAGDELSLREAIRDAVSGETIAFDSTLSGATLTLTGGQLEIDGELTIDASALNARFTIDANGSVTNHRVFNIPVSAAVTLDSLILKGGKASDGDPPGFGASGDHGGCINSRAQLTIRNSMITGNAAGDGADSMFGGGGFGGSGGGIFSTTPGNLIVENCRITHNRAGNGGNRGTIGGTGGLGGEGGGISCAVGTLTVTRSVVSHNRSGDGGNGGGSNDGGRAGRGGGIAQSSRDLIINDSALIGNLTGRGGDGGTENGDGGGGGIGGAIYSSGGSLILTNVTVAENKTGAGGEAGLAGGVSGSAGVGGGIYQVFESAVITHSTIVQNRAAGSEGGGLYYGFQFFDSLQVENTVIAENTGNGSPSDVTTTGTQFAFEGVNFIGTNISVESLAAPGAPNANGDFVGTTAAPLDPMLSSHGNFGGSTPTALPLPGSPLIDPAGATTPVAIDQRGYPRPQGTGPDVGAHEIYLGTGFVDTDFDTMDDQIEPIYDFNVGVADGHLDADADGSSNADELRNGTDPLSGSSLLQMTRIRLIGLAGGGEPVVDVTFTTFPGLSYTLECDSSLRFDSPEEIPVPGDITEFTKTINSIQLEPGTDFLRVRRN